MTDGAQYYFARLHVLLTEAQGRQVIVQSWFPSKYISDDFTDKKKNKKAKNRRSQFYLSTKKEYSLVRDDKGDVVGIEKHCQVIKISAVEDVENDDGTTIFASHSKDLPFSGIVIVDKVNEFKWKRVVPPWELEEHLQRVHESVGALNLSSLYLYYPHLLF